MNANTVIVNLWSVCLRLLIFSIVILVFDSISWESLRVRKMGTCERVSKSLLQGKTLNLCLLRRGSLLEAVLLISYAINNRLLIKKLCGPSLEIEGTHGNS